jgi:hypothetical protein
MPDLWSIFSYVMPCFRSWLHGSVFVFFFQSTYIFSASGFLLHFLVEFYYLFYA